MSVRVRVLLVDDQALVRAGFRSILEREPDLDVVGEAADGLDALEQLARTPADVVLMDVRMPRLDGIEATRLVLQRHPATRVVVLTTYDLDEYLLRALRAGASGFLLKDVRAEQLPAAVRAAALGDVLLSGEPTRRLAETFIAPPAAPSPVLERLSAREREVLRLVAEGCTNGEVAGRLHLAETTVKTYVGRLLDKLAARDRVGLVIAAYDHGLVGG